MNTTPTTGTVNFGTFVITFATGEDGNWVTMYNAELDDEVTREYTEQRDTLETVTLLITSQTAREEFFNA